MRRITIFFNILGYLLFLGVWIAIYLFYRDYAIFLFVVALLCLVPFSLWSSFRLHKNIQVSCQTKRTMVEKDTVFVVEVVIDNPTILVARNIMLCMELENRFIGKVDRQYVTMPIRAKGKTSIPIELKGMSCGLMSIRMQGWHLYDWLGISVRKSNTTSECSVMVMPQTHEVVMDLYHIGHGEGSMTEQTIAKKGDDVSQIDQIREYVPGDRLQNIHWKLSAKSDEFMVKEYSAVANHDIVLLVELGMAKEPGQLDNVLELYFSAMAFLCENQRKMLACWVEDGTLSEQRIEQKDQIHDLIEKIYQAWNQSEGHVAYHSYKKLYGEAMGNVLYFDSKNSVALLDEIQEQPEMEHGEAVAVWL